MGAEGTRGIEVAGHSGTVSSIHPDARDGRAAAAIETSSGVVEEVEEVEKEGGGEGGRH